MMNYTQAINRNGIFRDQLYKMYEYLHYNAKNFDKYSLVMPVKYLCQLGKKYSNSKSNHSCIPLYLDLHGTALANYDPLKYKKFGIRYFHLNTKDVKGKSGVPIYVWTKTPYICCNTYSDFNLELSISKSSKDTGLPAYIHRNPRKIINKIRLSGPNLVKDLERYIIILRIGLHLKMWYYNKLQLHRQTIIDCSRTKLKSIHQGPYSWKKVFGTNHKSAANDKMSNFETYQTLLKHY